MEMWSLPFPFPFRERPVKLSGPAVLSLRPKRSDNFAMTTPPNPNAYDSPECARVERYDII